MNEIYTESNFFPQNTKINLTYKKKKKKNVENINPEKEDNLHVEVISRPFKMSETKFLSLSLISLFL
jgi:hypothetical protein